MDKDSFYSLIKSGQPENCMIALEIAKALAREDRFFVDFKIALDLAIKYSGYDFRHDIKIYFLRFLSNGNLHINKFRKKSFPPEWYTLAELVNSLYIDYYGGEKLPEGFELFNKTKELNIYVRSDTTVGEEVVGMDALKKYTVRAKYDLKISPKIAFSNTISELYLYSETGSVFINEEIKNIKRLESLNLMSRFEGIPLKELSLKHLSIELHENKYPVKSAMSTNNCLDEENSLPAMLERLKIYFYGKGNYNKFLRDSVFRLENLTHLHLDTSKKMSMEIGEELLGLKKLKNVFVNHFKKEYLFYFAQLPELEKIEIGCGHPDNEVEDMHNMLYKMGSKIKIIPDDLPF